MSATGRTKSCRGAIAGLGASIVIGATVALWQWSVPPRLMDRARPLTTPGVRVAHFWLSDHELLAAEPQGPDSDLVRLFREDIRSGRRVALPGLTRLCAKHGGTLVLDQLVGWTLSRGNSWLLLHQDAGYVAMRLDGSRMVTWKEDGFGWEDWLDDHRFVAFKDRKIRDRTGQVISYRLVEATIRDVDRPAAERHIRLDERLGLDNVGMLVSSEDRIFLQPPGDRKSVAHPTLFSLRVPLRPADRYTVAFPPGSETGARWLSNDGQRLLWYVELNQPPSPLDRLVGILRREEPLPHKFESLWVSRPDGSHLHEVGRVEIDHSDPNRAVDSSLFDIEWMPGSKFIVFRRAGQYYLAPVD